MASVALTAAQRTVLEWIFFGHTQNALFALVAEGFLQIVALVASSRTLLPHLLGAAAPQDSRRAPFFRTSIVMGVLWTAAKYIYILVLPHLDFRAVYGPFEVSVGLITWAFISGLLLLGGAYVSATRQALRETRDAEFAGSMTKRRPRVERLHHQVVRMIACRQHRHQRRPILALHPNHRHIRRPRIRHQQQVLVRRKRQRIRP